MLTPVRSTNTVHGPTAERASEGGREGERGSVIMSMLVLMVIGMLAASMFAYSQSSARASMRQEMQRSVTDGLDAAMANAMSRIELGENSSFTGSGTINDVSYTYTATKEATLSWTVEATASRSSSALGSISRGASASLTGAYAGDSPYALFTTKGMRISSNNHALSEPIGSNGAVSVSGNARGLAIHTFTPSGSCTGCTNQTTQSPTWPTPQPPDPTDYQNCPQATLTQTNGNRSRVYGFLGTVDGKNGKPFRCTFRTDNPYFGHWPTILYQTVNIINPPVIIHVDSKVTLWFLRANLNPGGDPRDLIVEAVGGPTSGGGYEYGRFFDDGTKMTGILDAPSREVTVDTAFDITGRATLGSLTFTNNSLRVSADARVVDATIEWTSSAWHSVAP